MLEKEGWKRAVPEQLATPKPVRNKNLQVHGRAPGNGRVAREGLCS